MAALIDRRAFSDFHNLVLLGEGRTPSLDETKRRIFLAERRTDAGRPDHFYKGYLEQRLGNARTLGELPRIVLQRLAERYVERREGRLAIRFDRFVEWHELLPYVSPLAVLVAFLIEEGRGPEAGRDPREYLYRELGETALLGPLDRSLDDLVERKGLYELHMHLNGSTELDIIWPAACASPDAFYRELKDQWSKHGPSTAELYDQIESGLTPAILYRRLRAARRARRYVADAIVGIGRSSETCLYPNLNGLLAVMRCDRPDSDFPHLTGASLSEHPIQIMFPRKSGKVLVDEAAWLYACLLKLRHDPANEVVGIGLYYSLLVLSQISRLSVQQADETGFDQFQKYTLVGARETIEKVYVDRFMQLNGREPFDTLAHLEGRFAPKDTLAATFGLVTRIVVDYLSFRGCRFVKRTKILRGPPPPCLTGRGCDAGQPARGRLDTELTLVAHFIKRPPNLASDEAQRVMHSDLRRTLRDQSRILGRIVRDNAVVRSLLRAVDGAANELHAPPEPFAPAFRAARRAGIPNATFHVGEDFRHLISGIRATSEALVYLELGPGDRLGHATALGIDPELWFARAADRSMMPRIDVLDDAVFAHRVLAEMRGFERDIVRLEGMIANYSEKVYGVEHSPSLLHRAWELRSLDILEVRRVELALAKAGKVIDDGTVVRMAGSMAMGAVDPMVQAELSEVCKKVSGSGSAYEVLSRRHALDQASRRDLVEVEARVVSVEALLAMQEFVLADVNARGVALETLPTSNLRISYYDTLAEHHLFRWLGLAGPALQNRPTIVVGSDDPGIFATSLKNEFAAIASILRTRHGKTAQEASDIVEALVNSARVRRFRPREP